MNIAVITGGLSTERDVAISSGAKISNALRKKGHNVVFIDVFMGFEGECNPEELFKDNADLVTNNGVTENIPDTEQLKKLREDKSDCFLGKNVVEICRYADIAFFGVHGGEGENGQLQATFDILGIKYTGSGYLAAALAMDKGISKALFNQHEILTPKSRIFKKNDNPESWDIFPCVIKPCSGGSSVGIAKADDPDAYCLAVEDAFRYEDSIIVEQFISGREFSVGILGNEVLPPVEIIPTTGFYDYKAKYQEGLTIEVCPADITETEDETLRNCALKAYNVLNLSSYARIDFILDKNGDAYCLEANTLPGMTPTSLLPKEAEAVGIDYPSLCEKIVEISLDKYR